jgi:hypothetical protein
MKRDWRAKLLTILKSHYPDCLWIYDDAVLELMKAMDWKPTADALSRSCAKCVDRITELEATIARIDSVVARMINEEVWADDGHRIAGIIRGDKQALENDDG